MKAVEVIKGKLIENAYAINLYAKPLLDLLLLTQFINK